MSCLKIVDVSAKTRRLKRNAVPSVNLPESTVKGKEKNQKQISARAERNLKRCTPSEKTGEEINVQKTTENDVFAPTPNISELGEKIKNYVSSVVDDDLDLQFLRVQDAGVQTEAQYPLGSILWSVKTDEELSSVTGIESFQVFNAIVEMVKVVYIPKSENAISIREKVFMTYTKLKQNCSYSFLAILFKRCTASYCKKIFFETIKLLSVVLKEMIVWPEPESFQTNIPKCFENFEDTKIVLDCTEIFMQHPKNFTQQLITYSSYKGNNTWKIMTGVSPAGDIIWMSPVYGGRISDKTIVEQSDLMKYLKAGDAVMVDKGFLIDDYCDKHRLKLIRPPFLRDKKQFTKEEALNCAKIAAARVHIERSNQRLKNFKVLGDKMPANLQPVLEDIFIVIAGTVNLSAPILKDDKFMGN